MPQTHESKAVAEEQKLRDTIALLQTFKDAPTQCFENYYAAKGGEPMSLMPSAADITTGSITSPELQKAINTLCDRLDEGNRTFIDNLQCAIPACADTVFHWLPIKRVGIYVPYRYPSTAYTFLSAAQAAGVEELVVYLPIHPTEGGFDAASACVARRYGAHILSGPARYAFPSLAFGTGDSSGPCHLICGPCGTSMNLIKQLSALLAGCSADMSAGPSELVVVADGITDLRQVRLDLLSQLEHGPDSKAYLILVNEKEAGSTEAGFTGEPRIEVISAATSAQAVEWINAKGPETVVVYCGPDEAYYKRNIRAAGVLYINGANSLGDYGGIGRGCADPTGGFARSQSGISPLTFMRLMPVVAPQIIDKDMIEAAGSISQYEQFIAHHYAITNSIKK